MNIYISTEGTGLEYTHIAKMRKRGTELFYGATLRKVRIKEDELLMLVLKLLKNKNDARRKKSDKARR